MHKKNFSYVEAVNEALIFTMKKNKNVICYGLGVNDPKTIFGTTKNLEKFFGKKKSF